MALPLLAPLIAAGIGAGTGIFQTIKARQLEKKNPFTPRTVNPLLAQNQAQAQNQALVGMPQQQYNNAINQQQQNLASILASASRTGRNIPLQSLLRQSNQATQSLNAMDAQARQQNRGIAMQQNQVLANEQQNVRSWNVEQPYLRNMQRVADMRSAGMSNIFGALSLGANAAMMGGQGGGAQAASAGSSNLLSNPFPQFGTPNYGLGGRLS